MSEARRRWFPAAVPGSVVLGWLLVVGAEWQGLQPWGSSFVHGLGEFALPAVALGMLVAAGLLPAGLVGRVRPSVAVVVGVALGIALLVAGLAAVRAVHRDLRHSAVRRVESRARPLVEAIEAYTRRRGHPPSSLTELVPTDLPAIPSTGMGAFPFFKYARRGIPGDPPSTTDDPWRLYIDTPFGLGFDSMVYLPSGRYPTVGWGGAVVPVGSWAYVWE